VEWSDDEPHLRVHVCTPPVDGQANAAVVEVVAKSLGIAKSRVLILRGEKSRNKRLKIEGLEMNQLKIRLVRP
jgi:uncharacterized protein